MNKVLDLENKLSSLDEIIVEKNLSLMQSWEVKGMFYFLEHLSVGERPREFKHNGILFPCKYARFHFTGEGRIITFDHDLKIALGYNEDNLFFGDVRVINNNRGGFKNEYKDILDFRFSEDRLPNSGGIPQKATNILERSKIEYNKINGIL
jgi:hypothetical protein